MNSTLRPKRNTDHAILYWLTLCSLVLSLFNPAVFAKDADPQQAKVMWVKGKARYTTDPESKNWKVIEKGALIPAGAVIEIADSSNVDLSLQDAQHRTFDLRTSTFQTCLGCSSFLRIYEKSVITLDFGSEKIKRKTLPYIRIDLRAGSIRADSHKLPPQANLHVTCPHYTAKIIPAGYAATADGKFIIGPGSAILEIKDKKNHSVTITKELTSNLSYDASTDQITPMDEHLLRSFKTSGDTPHYRPPPIAPTQPPLRRGI